MAAYTQYDGNMSQTTMAQRLLNNGSEYIAVRVGQYRYLFVQGKVEHEGNRITYDGQSWLYNTNTTGTNDLVYNESDEGTINLSYNSYVYSSLDEFQSLTVNDVYPMYSFYGILALILVFTGFQFIKRRFVL